MAVNQNKKVISVIEKDESSTLGINSRQHLAQVSSILQKQILNKLMDSGVTITCPDQTFIGSKVKIAPDTVIEPGCMIMGDTEIEKNCIIGPYVKLNNVKIKEGTNLQFCIVENTNLSKDNKILPFTSVEG